MLDVTVVVLTYNEELHIRRCLENIVPWAKRVVVIDCHSSDKTVELCEQYGAEVVEHDWPGNQAAQFNWAMDNLSFDTKWILRLDADEYLLPELATELMEKVPGLPDDVTGIEFRRRHIFMGKWVKHGIYPVVLLRMFRTGCGRYESRLMDEHITLSHGRSMVMDNDFCDHSLISLSDYCKKHINYAQREAVEVLDEKYCLAVGETGCWIGLAGQASDKRKKKSKYNSMPLFWRSFGYFVYRFIFKGGFLDGKPGFVFAFIQGWWYRTIVDANVYNAEKACGSDKRKLIDYIKNNFGIELKR